MNFSWLDLRLRNAYGDETAEKIKRGYDADRPVTLRVNSLKKAAFEVREELSALGVDCTPVPWYRDALIVQNVREDTLRRTPLYERGEIYLQSLSSMLPPLYLNPQGEENVLDMTAAPGGKTTQMSALSDGKAFLTACEKDSLRAERLRYNVQKQGAPRVTVLVTDAEKLDDFFRFDKILLDAPCSGSGTFAHGKTVKISEKLAENSSALQKRLLKKAIKLLKKGGELVYSTCSVLPCENGEAIEFALKQGGVELVPLEPFEGLETLAGKYGTVTVCPNELYEGFFVAKLRKI